MDETLKYTKSLMLKNSIALGFIPEGSLEKYIEKNQLWLQHENDDPCGYVIFGNNPQVCKIYQCCIQIDARRNKSASDLVQRLITKSTNQNRLFISLWCASDLQSNVFWKSMGFYHNGIRDGGKQRKRVHNNWVYDLGTKLI